MITDHSIIDRQPTVTRLLKGFPSRLAQAREFLSAQEDKRDARRRLKEIDLKYAKVKRCVTSWKRTNGKTVFNLILCSSKLNDLLIDVESAARLEAEAGPPVLFLGPSCDDPEYLGRVAEDGRPGHFKEEKR
jgi:hypothetical protein